ncbi:MAG: hypothetical protein NVS3B3_04240 [Aquirhabdus sp.]
MSNRFDNEYVSANYRYISAYNELNARTSQRQQGLTIFISFFVGLLAALIASHGATGLNNAHIEWILLGFPVASASFAFLNYKYELIITNIRAYLSQLEHLNDAHLSLPSYNSDAEWMINSDHARRFHDYACAVLIVACNSIGLSAFYVLYPERFVLSGWVIFVVVSVAIFTATMHWMLPSFSVVKRKRVI